MTNRLTDKSSHYDEELAETLAIWAKRLQEQLNLQVIDLFEPIAIFNFLSAFKWMYDTNGIHEKATLWLLLFYEAPRHCPTQCTQWVQL